MPIYDFHADCGHRFEALLASWAAPDPGCPHCGTPAHRIPGLARLAGAAAPPPGAEGAPTSWEGAHRGDREYVAGWRRRLEQRREFEGRHPEHAVRRDAVAAHEGVFARDPLSYRELAERAGDTGSVRQAWGEAAVDRERP